MPSELIEFWQRFNPSNAPFAHPDDWSVLQKNGGQHIHREPQDFDDFVSGQQFGDFSDTKLHLSLFPVPYGGNLRAAEIVILLLNPGFSFSDYYAETRMPAFRSRLEGMLAQNFERIDFPFLWLDPEYCWHAGFVWWERNLRDVVVLIAETKFGGRYLDALRDISRRLAYVELVPYHSRSFKAHRLIQDLPSVKAARRFAQNGLTEAANKGDKTIIITRQEREWGIPEVTLNLVVYKGGLTRGASLGPNTPGGKKILDCYGIAANR